MIRKLLASVLIGVCAASSPVLAEPDWASIKAVEIPMFYPGPSAYEWVLSGQDHTGAHKLKEKIREKKQNCFDCHENDADVIGLDVVSGKPVGKSRAVIDPAVPKGQRGTYPMKIKAAHGDGKLYLRFEWENAAPAADINKLDPVNEIKLSVLFDGGEFEETRMNGCWQTCHMDLRSMPETPANADQHAKAKALGWDDGVTKYLPDTRSALSLEAKPRGGWNKLRTDREIEAELKAGRFLDLIQYRSGVADKPIDGYVLDSRRMTGGKSLLNATGSREGNKWTVTFVRSLKGEGKGDHTIQAGKPITFGVSVHENHANARFHHVSLGYTLGLDDKTAFINALGR